MRLFTALKKNIVAILFVGIVVALVLYMTQMNEEGFQVGRVGNRCVFDSYNATPWARGYRSCRAGYLLRGSKCEKDGTFGCPAGTIRSVANNQCYSNRCPSSHPLRHSSTTCHNISKTSYYGIPPTTPHCFG